MSSEGKVQSRALCAQNCIKNEINCLQVGDTVKLMYVPQDRMNLDGEKTVFENINNG
jgi:hypothetical protein